MKIGIDPDLVKSGVALVDVQKILELHALSFCQLTQFIEPHPDAEYVVENVEYDKTTNPRPGQTKKKRLKISPKCRDGKRCP